MKFLIFREIFFSDTHFIIELFKKVMVMEKMSKKWGFSRQNVPKMLNFKEYFSLHRFLCEEFSLQRFFFTKNSLLTDHDQYSQNINIEHNVSENMIFSFQVFRHHLEKNNFESNIKHIKRAHE